MKRYNKEVKRLLMEIGLCLIVVICTIMFWNNIEAVNASSKIAKSYDKALIVDLIDVDDNNYFIKNYSGEKVKFKLVLVVDKDVNVQNLKIRINDNKINVDSSQINNKGNKNYITINENNLSEYASLSYTVDIISKQTSTYQLKVIV